MREFVNKIAESRDWATFFNRKFGFTKYAMIDKTQFPVVRSKSGELYKVHTDLCTYKESFGQYTHKDIQMNDIVIDIGANIGAFSLLAAKKCRWVHAYEPVLFDVLVKNIGLNVANNIVPHNIALGDGNPVEIEWQGQKVTVPSMTLTQMIEQAGGTCSFLKCDSEGSEWGIQPEELLDIHRIEIEFHRYKVNRKTEHGKYLLNEIHSMFEYVDHYDQKHDTYWLSGVNRIA
jgi:FkbM family methyltransferase